MNLRKCSICKELKPEETFGLQNKKLGYFHSWCPDCRNRKARESRQIRGEQWRAYQRNYAKQHRVENPDRYILQELRQRCKRYGVTPEWYQGQLEKQNSVCALCLKPEISERRKGSTVRSLAIDHCHVNGTARGLLCSACNQAVGKIEAAPGWIERALEYLKETRDDGRNDD